MSGKIFLMKINKFFGERLHKARLARGYTRAKLSQLCGIHEQALMKYEKGQSVPAVENLKKLSVALDVSADYFIYPHADMEGIPKIKNAALYERYLVLEKLEEEDLNATLTLLDALILKSQFKKALLNNPAHQKAAS